MSIQWLLSCVLLFFSFNSLGQFKYHQSFENLGYENGLASESLMSSEVVYFNIPDSKYIDGASLLIDVTFSSVLNKPSYLKITSGKRLLSTIQLPQENQAELLKITQKIEVPRSLLKKSSLPITFSFYQTLSEDRCVDNEISADLIHISELSGLEISMNRSPIEIKDYLNTLGQDVLIKVPNRPITKNELENLLVLNKVLKQGNRSISHQSLSTKIPAIVMGNTKELLELLQAWRLNTKMKRLVAFNPKSSMQVLDNGQESVLTLNTDIVKSIKSLDSKIFSLLIAPEANLDHKRNLEKSKTLILHDLTNIDFLSTIALGKKLGINIRNNLIPGGLYPREIHLSLTTQKYDPKNPIKSYVYLGNKLILAEELENTGRPQLIKVDLPDEVDSKGIDLSFEFILDDSKGNCSGVRNDLKVSILPDSKIIFREIESEKLRSFAEFARLAQKGLAIHVEEELLKAPKDWNHWIAHASTVLRSLDTSLLGMEIVTFKEKPSIKKGDISNLFITSNKEINIEGGISLLQDNKISFPNVDIKLSPLSRLHFMQIASYEGEKVLHYNISNKLKTNIRHLNIDKNNTSLFDQDEVLLTYNTDKVRIPNSAYSQGVSFKKMAYEYRFYILVLIWVLSLVAFIRFGKFFK